MKHDHTEHDDIDTYIKALDPGATGQEERLDDATLLAWRAGQLSDSERETVMLRLAECRASRERLYALAQQETDSSEPATVEPASNVVPLPASNSASPNRRTFIQISTGLAAAAALTVGVLTYGGGPVGQDAPDLEFGRAQGVRQTQLGDGPNVAGRGTPQAPLEFAPHGNFKIRLMGHTTSDTVGVFEERDGILHRLEAATHTLPSHTGGPDDLFIKVKIAQLSDGDQAKHLLIAVGDTAGDVDALKGAKRTVLDDDWAPGRWSSFWLSR
ncbi:MAG: hypothetical protein ACE366_22010 [Bradymonadia bacterium]